MCAPLYFKVKVAQSCPAHCDLMDYRVRGILQARILEWVAFPFSRGSSQPRDRTQICHIAGGFFTSWATGEAHKKCTLVIYWMWADTLEAEGHMMTRVRHSLGHCTRSGKDSETRLGRDGWGLSPNVLRTRTSVGRWMGSRVDRTVTGKRSLSSAELWGRGLSKQGPGEKRGEAERASRSQRLWFPRAVPSGVAGGREGQLSTAHWRPEGGQSQVVQGHQQSWGQKEKHFGQQESWFGAKMSALFYCGCFHIVCLCLSMVHITGRTNRYGHPTESCSGHLHREKGWNWPFTHFSYRAIYSEFIPLLADLLIADIWVSSLSPVPFWFVFNFRVKPSGYKDGGWNIRM